MQESDGLLSWQTTTGLHHKLRPSECSYFSVETLTVTKPGGKKENRREWRGRDGWLVCFQRRIKRRFNELRGFGDLR
jgi:hypothetical protein